MHDLLGNLLAIAVAGVWWISIIVIGILYQKFVGHHSGWKQAAIIILGFMLAGACTVVAAHILEHTFHVRILAHDDD
jgi:hypothetical protein